MLRRAKVLAYSDQHDDDDYPVPPGEKKLEDLRCLYDLIPNDLEIVFIDKEWGHIFPGIYLFCGPCRFVRPIKDLKSGREEKVGSLEQIFLKIAVSESELRTSREILKQDIAKISGGLVKITDAKGRELLVTAESKARVEGELMPKKRQRTSASRMRGYDDREDGEDFGGYEVVKDYDDLKEIESVVYTHREWDPIRPLSIVASLTPFQNHNQSPRCMYQCQMLKQTMGTPALNHTHRTDNKVYKIDFPQRPMVRGNGYNLGKWDTHPAGKNAIVAVITETGFDMEDAMIINKMGWERGFMHGSVYKQKIIHAPSSKDHKSRFEARNWKFDNYNPVTNRHVSKHKHIDKDGLPQVGVKLTQGDHLCVSRNEKGETNIETFKDSEDAYVEQVNVISGGSFQGGDMEEGAQKVSIKLRYPRRPLVGDKFASRHGQKGIFVTFGGRFCLDLGDFSFFFFPPICVDFLCQLFSPPHLF